MTAHEQSTTELTPTTTVPTETPPSTPMQIVIAGVPALASLAATFLTVAEPLVKGGIGGHIG